jgi:redox-sensitive bicupin YhaK (pirin superfamily)
MNNTVIDVTPLGFPWPTLDPFLFCVYHRDDYPAGNERQGPDPSLLSKRTLGNDFTLKDGFRMYHGHVVPGFPRHPHRGFETVTLLTSGYCDHTDSLGATARFGPGDAQWMTAGGGIEHAEMFPLRRRDAGNPLELFQLWLNLPAKSKRVDPYFSMFWRETIPRQVFRDDAGRETEVIFVAGDMQNVRPPQPPPDSWASEAEANVAIWLLQLAPGATFQLPPARPDSNRAIYFFRGDRLGVDGRDLPANHRAVLRADAAAELSAGAAGAEILLLQGRPIGEPVVQHGPFVMNTEDEIREAFMDYQRDRFGQHWPWGANDPVHDRDEGRFARHADGRVDRPTRRPENPSAA